MKSSRCHALCLFVMLSLHLNKLSLQRDISEKEFYFDRDGEKSIILANHSVTIIKTNSIFQCAWSCVKFKECVSLNFSPTKGFCQLNDAVAAEYPEDVQPQEHHWYFELRGKSLQQMDLSFITMATTSVLSSSEEMTTTETAKPEANTFTSIGTTNEKTRAVTSADKTTSKLTTLNTSPDKTTNEMTTTEESSVKTTQPTTLLSTVDTTERTTTLQTTETIDGQDTTLSYQVREECYQYLFYAASAPPDDGVYTIQNSFGTFSVYCTMWEDGGGWTVIQRRIGNSVSFDRDWTAYRNGFGDLNSNFWLGLDKIKSICNARDCELLVVMTDWTDARRTAHYSGFSVEAAFSVEGTDLYVSSFVGGNAGNSLPLAVFVPFSSFDADSDASGSNCARTHGGGWWYTDCGDASPNGNYYPSNDNMHSDGIIWQSWQGATFSLKSMELRVRNIANV